MLSGTSLWRILREEVEAVFDAPRSRIFSDAFWLGECKAFEKLWPSRSVLRMHLERHRDYRVEYERPKPVVEAK